LSRVDALIAKSEEDKFAAIGFNLKFARPEKIARPADLAGVSASVTDVGLNLFIIFC
jgi:hypothetical protein